MTKTTMIKNYRKFSAANAYILGFEYKHQIYCIMIDEIPPRYMQVEHESSKKGGAAKLQLRLHKAHKEELLRKVQPLSAMKIYLSASITKVLSLKE